MSFSAKSSLQTEQLAGSPLDLDGSAFDNSSPSGGVKVLLSSVLQSLTIVPANNVPSVCVLCAFLPFSIDPSPVGEVFAAGSWAPLTLCSFHGTLAVYLIAGIDSRMKWPISFR